MAKNREKDVRRSVGSHQEMMAALGRATGGWSTQPVGTDGRVHRISSGTGPSFKISPELGGNIGDGRVVLSSKGERRLTKFNPLKEKESN